MQRKHKPTQAAIAINLGMFGYTKPVVGDKMQLMTDHTNKITGYKTCKGTIITIKKIVAEHWFTSTDDREYPIWFLRKLKQA